MEWNLIQESKYYKSTNKYSGKEWKIIQTSKSNLKIQSYIASYSSNEWNIIQNSAYPVYTYDEPPDSLMF